MKTRIYTPDEASQLIARDLKQRGFRVLRITDWGETVDAAVVLEGGVEVQVGSGYATVNLNVLDTEGVMYHGPVRQYTDELHLDVNEARTRSGCYERA